MNASTQRTTGEPVDPDVSVRTGGHTRELLRRHRLATLMVALGGAFGACVRYAAVLAWPTPAGQFPWTTLAINAIGCAVIGVFMVVITDIWAAHRLVRPFFGTGVLGGFTTFSTYAVEVQQLAAGGAVGPALGYLLATLVAALGAVWTTATLTRHIHRRRSR